MLSQAGLPAGLSVANRSENFGYEQWVSARTQQEFRRHRLVVQGRLTSKCSNFFFIKVLEQALDSPVGAEAIEYRAATVRKRRPHDDNNRKWNVTGGRGHSTKDPPTRKIGPVKIFCDHDHRSLHRSLDKLGNELISKLLRARALCVAIGPFRKTAKISQRPEGLILVKRVCSEPEQCGIRFEAGHNLLHKAGLSDARSAHDQGDVRTLPSRIERLLEKSLFSRPPDERERGRPVCQERW